MMWKSGILLCLLLLIAPVTAGGILIAEENASVSDDWSLFLNGSAEQTLTRADFIDMAEKYPASFDAGKYGLLEGADLRAVIGLVDDDDPATFNQELAAMNYTIEVYGHKKGGPLVSTVYSSELAGNNRTCLLGNRFDGIEMNRTGINGRVFFPLYLQGEVVDGTKRTVEKISEVRLILPAAEKEPEAGALPWMAVIGLVLAGTALYMKKE